MKKFLALLLAALMVLAMFTACAKTATPSQEETTAPTETAEPAAPADETPADAPADDNPFAEEVTLHWAFPALQDSFPGFEAINEKLNEITKEKINAKIEFEMIPLGEYTEKMNMKFTAGEEFDICFTGAWNPYLPAVAKGAYAELTQDVLDKYAPDVVADLNSAVWDAIRVNGKLYGIPLQQIYVRQTGIRFNTELLNKYGFDPSTVKTLDDLDEYAATIKANEPDAVVIYNYGHLIYENMVNYLGYDVIVSNTTPGVVYYAAETPVVFNQFESEEFKALCEKMREWNLAGYFPTDAVTGADSVGENDIRAIDTDPAHKPGGDITEGQLRGYDITGIAFGPEAGFLTGAVSGFVSNFLFGQGPWTPWQMFAFGVAGFLAGVLAKKGWLTAEKRLPAGLFGGICVLLLIGPILDTCSLFTMSTEITAASAAGIYLAGLPVNAVHAFATFLTVFFLGKPIEEKLDRIKVKYGMMGGDEDEI